MGCEPDDSYLFFTEVPYPETLSHSDTTFRFELVREYGDRDQGMVFGSIANLAVSESGILAALDTQGCRIWTVDTRTGEWGVMGGCGEGPGEFAAASAAAFTGDTLVVFDSGRMSMVQITLAGEEIDRFQVPLLELGAWAVSDLYIGADGRILAGLDLLPNTVDAGHLQIVSFDRFGGVVDARGLVAPPIARSTPRSTLGPGSLCAGVVDKAGEVVVAVNAWGPQVAVLQSSDLKPTLSVRIPLRWAQAREHSRRPGYWGPMSPVPGVACGERYAVLGYRRQEYRSPAVIQVLSASIVVVDLQQRALGLLGGNGSPEQGSILLMTPGAAIGDHFFFFTNSFFDHPVIREYRLVDRMGQG